MKRHIHLIIALAFSTLYIIICLPASAQKYSYNTRWSLSAHNFVDSIPIEFENNHIFIRAHTRRGDYRFCLDTGSSQGIVYADGTFPYTRVLGKITSHDANGISRQIDVVEYPEFRIGSLTIRGYAGSLLNSHVRHTGYDAVLGFDLVNKGLTVKLDVANGVMVVTDDPRYFDREGGFAVKYRLPRWVPMVNVFPYPGCADEVRFDTGSQRLYVMSDESRKKFTQKSPDFSSQVEGMSYGSLAIGSFGAERSGEVAFLWLDELNWGGFGFRDYHTTTTQGSSRIGADILNYGSVVMNPRRKELIFQPYDGGEACMVSNEQMDIAFVPDKGRAMVGFIREGSQHYKNGFRQGDVILSVDGQNVRTLSQFLSYPFIKGRKHQFTVLGADGRMRTVNSER